MQVEGGARRRQACVLVRPFDAGEDAQKSDSYLRTRLRLRHVVLWNETCSCCEKKNTLAPENK